MTTDEMIQELASRRDFAGIILYPEPRPEGTVYDVKIAKAAGVTGEVILHLLEQAERNVRQPHRSAGA